jgi:hypothetical protein
MERRAQVVNSSTKSCNKNMLRTTAERVFKLSIFYNIIFPDFLTNKQNRSPCLRLAPPLLRPAAPVPVPATRGTSAAGAGLIPATLTARVPIRTREEGGSPTSLAAAAAAAVDEAAVAADEAAQPTTTTRASLLSTRTSCVQIAVV